MTEMRAVFVVGIPRGATTWIGRAIAQTKGATYVHEPDGLNDAFAFRARRRDGLPAYPVLAAEDEAPQWQRLWDGVFAGGRPPRAGRGRLAQRAYRSAGEDARLAARTGGRITLPLRIADALAMPREPDARAAVVAKSVNSALAMEWIWKRWKPHVLVVQRDLRNVIASWLSLGFAGPRPEIYAMLAGEARERWSIELPMDEDETVRSAAFCAMSMVALRDGLRAHPQWHTVTHEDVCVDPASRLRATADALGLEWTPAAEAFVHGSNRPGQGYANTRVASELPDQWKRRLPPEQVAAVTRVLERFPDDL